MREGQGTVGKTAGHIPLGPFSPGRPKMLFREFLFHGSTVGSVGDRFILGGMGVPDTYTFAAPEMA